MPIQKKSDKKRKIARHSSGQVECRVMWRRVEDVLPDDQQDVLVSQQIAPDFDIKSGTHIPSKKKVKFAKYEAVSKRFIAPGSSMDGIHLVVGWWNDITHWMPLPEPPST